MKLRTKLISWLLVLTLAVTMLPVTALAAGGWFYLSAVGNGKIIIAPERVTYTAGQSVGQALEASGHTFTGLADGMVSMIDDTVANFTRSDQNGGYDLHAPASEVTHFCFTDAADSRPSAQVQALMTAMAEYQCYEIDVQNAAKAAYDRAYSQYPGISDTTAASCALALNNAVDAYLENQNGVRYTVSFPNCRGLTLYAVNAYGKQFADENGDGVLSLPAGNYTFLAAENGRQVSGTVQVQTDMTVSASLPGGDWLLLDTLMLSGSYGEADFLENRFAVEQENSRTVRATIPDRFTGAVYAFMEYDTALSYGSVPTLTVLYTDASGAERTVEQAFGSYRTGAPGALKSGAAGNTLTYRMSTTDEQGYTVSQDYSMVLERIPTLRSLTVKDQKGVPQTAQQSFDGTQTQYTYRVLSTVTQVTVVPEAFDESYTVKVNGQMVENGEVTLPVTEGTDTTVTVDVIGGGFTTTYTLTVTPGAGRRITFNTTAADIVLRVVNKNGDELAFTREKNNAGYNAYLYTLVPGETYTYIASRDDTYFASKAFTLEESANAVITVGVKTEDWLKALSLGNKQSAEGRDTIALEQSFDPASHSYTASLPDMDSSVYTWITSESGVDTTVLYEQIHYSASYDGVQRQVSVSSDARQGKILARALLSKSGYGNQLTYRLSQTDQTDGVTYYQDYTVTLRHVLTLDSLSVKNGSETIPLYREDGTQGYDGKDTVYRVTVPGALTALTVTAAVHPTEKNCRYGESDPGYRISFQGEDFTENGTVTVALTGDQTPQTLELVLTNNHVPQEKTVYTLRVEKAAPVYVQVAASPENALLTIHDQASGNRLWAENGSYMLSDGYSYRYTLTREGYVGKTGTITAAKDENGAAVLLVDGQALIPVVENGTITVQMPLRLQQAAVNTTIDPDITAQWGDFRGNADNNGVTDAPTPTTAQSGTLYWANQLGSGFGSDAVGCPILVDDCLITYSGNTIYRVDAISGEILATGKMDHNSSYSITPPVYAQGMIFVALSDGTVQAFHAKTLESLWVYRDPLGGQPNSPITVCGSYLYTGFWNAENTPANYVCLSITDEDPDNDAEEKLATWYHTQLGGFYWAGAYVCEDYLLVGTDDGYGGYTHDTSRLLLMEPKTGAILDSWDQLDADIRSTIARDETTGIFYFTSKGGSFYAVTVEQSGSSWRIGGKRRLELQNGTTATAMSTSTPVVYNGRAYVGVSGAGQFTAYSGHNITVIDLNAWNIAYRVPTQGYPQTSGLLTTSYEEKTGNVYVYFFDNYTPGKLRMLQDKAGQTEPVLLTVENGTNTLYVLFTPKGEEAEYAICSPIVDEYGTIYFKNDSARLMAFGSAMTELVVKKQPDKTSYAPQEAFDPTGMEVLAVYANGKSRDVTNYVTWPDALLEEGQSTLTLSFPYVMYHNAEGTAGTMTAGVTTRTPTVELEITVDAAMAEADGIEHVSRTEDGVTVTLNGMPRAGWSLIAASYDENGRQLLVRMVEATTQTQSIVLSEEGKTVQVFLVELSHDGSTMTPIDSKKAA